MSKATVQLPKDKITEFCKRNGIRKLSLFGSVLKGSAKPDSDVDLLVEFDPRHTPGLFGLTNMELELTKILGRKVDLRTPEDLSRYFRKEVIRSAKIQYEKRG
ncbi:MAG: nucleotidyltransferase family protein [Nitrospirae bacterium]|nr:nucleotidyltransferase family protein [Nitrospirota bacterium]MCL5238757.1 nucleotidyltransferase family protein [Nitrospirota bacterium]